MKKKWLEKIPQKKVSNIFGNYKKNYLFLEKCEQSRDRIKTIKVEVDVVKKPPVD